MASLLFRNADKELAFRRLFNDYYAPLCVWAKRFIQDDSEREDVVQEVFVKLWENYAADVDSLRNDTVVSFLKMCVRNACFNRLMHLHVEDKYAERYRETIVEMEQSDDDVLTLEELYAQLDAVLQLLPDHLRMVFVKSFYEGKTQSEVAQEMNISTKTVGRYKKKVMATLREYLNDSAFLLLLLIQCAYDNW